MQCIKWDHVIRHASHYIQESVTSAQQVLRAIYDTYETPCVTLVENRLGDYKYPSQEPDQVSYCFLLYKEL